MMQHRHSQSGFTLVELLVVLFIILIVFGVTMANFGQPQTGVSLSTTVDTLLNDLRNQQLLSMAGDMGTTTSQQPHGIYIQSNQYVLFSSNPYSAVDSNDFTVTPGQGVSLSTTLPGSQIVFAKGTGDVSGYVSGSNTVTVTVNGSSKIITIGRFGALSTN